MVIMVDLSQNLEEEEEQVGDHGGHESELGGVWKVFIWINELTIEIRNVFRQRSHELIKHAELIV